MSKLLDLGMAVFSRICDIKQYLMEIKLPVQVHIYVKNIKRVQELIFQANTDILDIEAYHREDMGFSQNRDIAKDISIRQLGNFKTSIYNIERETSAIYSDLCTWKASQTRPPAGASEEHTAAVVTKHTTLAKSPELNQNGDSTETQDLTGSRTPLTHHTPDATRVPNRAKDSDITFDEVSITELPDNVDNATAVEALQITQQKVQEYPRHQHTSQAAREATDP